MNSEQKEKCHVIIHSAATACAAGNAIPVPGLGIATDLVTLTGMVLSLSAVFGADVSKAAAEALVVLALKKQLQKQTAKVIGKELLKFIPFAGWAASAAISAALIEAAGWSIASDFASQYSKKLEV